LRGQLSKNRAKTFGRGETEIRRGQPALLENAKIVRIALNQDPGGFCAAAFNAKDTFGRARHLSTLCSGGLAQPQDF
jgi:hypothetical protein